MITIVYANDVAEAIGAIAEGFCPIECSFGPIPAIDELEMDHHGMLSHLDGVAIRAYRDRFGARKDDPRFVVTGAADADATFAIAALCGILPHTSRSEEFASASAPIKAAGTKDLTALADLVNRVDTAPIGVRLEQEPLGDILLLWNQLGGSGRDELAFYAGVDRWRVLTAGRPLLALLSAAKAEEAERVMRARSAKIAKVGDLVAVVESEVWGFDVWYAEVAPVIVAYMEKTANITIGLPNNDMAESFFGHGGLKNVMHAIGDGWGGRESIGGSPRGKRMTREDAVAAARILADHIRRAPAS